MTAAAFKACFTDWKLIRGRKCVQIVFEVPVEAADEAYHVLGGMPDPGKSVWCAIARLRDTDAGESACQLSPDREAATATTPPVAASRSYRTVAPEKRLVQQAGICCADPVFQRYLRECRWIVTDENSAASTVRLCCDVKSRSEFIPGSLAGDRWEKLYGQFLAWRDYDA